MSELVERLGETDLYATVSLTMTDGSTVEGLACPVEYFPEERFRMEVSPHEQRTRRIEIRATYRQGSWEKPEARTIDVMTDDSWSSAGTVTGVTEVSQLYPNYLLE